MHVIKTVMGNLTTQKYGKKGANKNNYTIAINKVTKKMLENESFQKYGKQQIADLFDLKNSPFGTTSVSFIEQQLDLVDSSNKRFEKQSQEKLFQDLVMNTPTIHRTFFSNFENFKIRQFYMTV